MTVADWIDDLERKAKAATPGPWYAWDRGVGWLIALDPDGDVRLPEGMRTDLGRREDAEFIAAANPTTILRLIGEVHRWKAAWEMASPLLTERDALAARLAAVEVRIANAHAFLDAEDAASEAKGRHVWTIETSLVRAALAAPTDTAKEN